MMHPDTELRLIDDEIGYGVFATRLIPRGTIIWSLCLFDRTYTPQEVAALPRAYQQVLAKYSYIEGTGNYVLCWDLGRYVNHSCEPAMLGVGSELEITVRDLHPGDPVTCEYGALNPTTPMHCRCGAESCRGIVRAEDVLDGWHLWDPLVAAALRCAGNVTQPLLPFVRDQVSLADWMAGRRPVPSLRDYYVEQSASPAPTAGGLPWASRSPALDI